MPTAAFKRTRLHSGQYRRNRTRLHRTIAYVRFLTVKIKSETAKARNEGAEARNHRAEARNEGANVRNDTAEARSEAVEAKSHTVDVRKQVAEVRNQPANARNHLAEARNDAALARKQRAAARKHPVDVIFRAESSQLDPVVGGSQMYPAKVLPGFHLTVEFLSSALSQQQCNAIARKLNTRPRKRLGFRTPLECFHESWSVLHFKLDVRCGRCKHYHPSDSLILIPGTYACISSGNKDPSKNHAMPS